MPRPLIAVDIGNSRIKLGLFDSLCTRLPEPCSTLALAGDPLADRQLPEWLASVAPQSAQWWIGSVNRPASSRLVDWLREHRMADAITLIASNDLPLVVDLERPDMVGIDRLIDAVGVNALRDAGRAAVVVDIGSAVTVDLVSPEGAFCGGAILPGLAMSARALHEFTDLLPRLEARDLMAAPPVLGTETAAAMQSGLFWGTLGAIREIAARMGQPFQQVPQLFLSGGAGPAVADLLGPDAHHVPHLTLSGIALARRHRGE